MRMDRKISLSIFLIVFISINAAALSPLCIDENVIEPSNILYKNNSRDILSYLVHNVTAPRFFYNASIGKDDNTVYAMGMCITESDPTVCSDCIRGATNELKSCPNQAAAYKWRSTHNALCFARYSNFSFFGPSNLNIEMHPLYEESNSKDIKTNFNISEFEEKEWKPFIDRLERNTSSEHGTSLSSRRYYATDQEFLTNFQTVYALMQCTPDLTSGQCGDCLGEIRRTYQNSDSSRGRQAGTIAWPQCFFRWDMQPFSGAFDPGETSNCNNYYCNNCLNSSLFWLPNILKKIGTDSITEC